MGGFDVRRPAEYELSRHDKVLKPKHYLELLDKGRLPWPTIEDKVIEDHSKADWLIKLLALIQVIWFVSQIIGRASQGLHVSTLELFTLSIVLCALVMYVSWWHKPFDVRCPVLVHVEFQSLSDEQFCDRVGILNSGGDLSDSYWYSAVLLLVCLGFGALHLVGWDFYFPSRYEQLFWRISSVGCSVLPLIILGFSQLRVTRKRERALDNLAYCTIGIYSLCRLYMFIEMFISLRSIPLGVYQTPQWSQYFPGFG